jgi:hypothetical protein
MMMTHRFITLKRRGGNPSSIWANMALAPFYMILTCKATTALRKYQKFENKKKNQGFNQDREFFLLNLISKIRYPNMPVMVHGPSSCVNLKIKYVFTEFLTG